MSIGSNYSNTAIPSFDTVAVLKTINIQSGELVNTEGYISSRDRGGCQYVIKTAAQAAADGDTIDGYVNFSLNNTNVAIKQHQMGVSCSTYAEMLALNPDAFPIGSVIKVTGTGIAGDFIVTTGSVTDDGGVKKSNATWSAATKHLLRLYDGGSVNVKWFGAKIDNATNDLASVTSAWEYCRPLGSSLYFPAGVCLVNSENNFPFRQTVYPPTFLLDCNGMTIFGDGPASILKTATIDGGDVLQLNGLKNFHVKNLSLQSTVSGTASGSNAISITGGFDNLTFDHIWCKDIGFVDKTTYVDGGKALSIQTPIAAQTVTCGTLTATNFFADGCVYGFGYEFDPVSQSTMSVCINVDIVAHNCRQGVVISGSEASSALNALMNNGVRVQITSVDCMQDIVLSRAHGCIISAQVVTTKTDNARTLSYTGSKWSTNDTISSVIGLIMNYGKNCKVLIEGSKGNCYNKAKIGAASDPLSTIGGWSDFSDVYINLSGTSSSTNVEVETVGGNNIKNSTIFVTTNTTSTLPAGFYTTSNNNTLSIGPSLRQSDVNITGALKFAYDSGGYSSYHSIFLSNAEIAIKQAASSSSDAIVVKMLNHSGTLVAGFRNDGAILSSGRVVCTSVGTVKGAMIVYDSNNALVGYVPVYTTYA